MFRSLLDTMTPDSYETEGGDITEDLSNDVDDHSNDD